MSTYNFHRHKKEYDGELVSHALDYYFPEWNQGGNLDKITIARGSNDLGERFFITISPERDVVIRFELIGNRVSIRSVWPKQLKHELLSLSREGDQHDDSTDKRYLMMIEDLRRKNV